MSRVTRATVGGIATMSLCGLFGGVANAEPQTPAAPYQPSSVWVLPGVDAGVLLDPLVQVPTVALQPVVGVLGAIAG